MCVQFVFRTKSWCNWYTWLVKYPTMHSCYSYNWIWCALRYNRRIHNSNIKYSHGEYEAVFEGYSWDLWKTIFATTHARRFEKTNVSQQSKWSAMYTWLNILHALPMEELSSSIEWTIFGQWWQHVNYFWNNNRPISLVLTCIFWNYGNQQRHQCFTKKSFGTNIFIWGVWQYILWCKLSTVF